MRRFAVLRVLLLLTMVPIASFASATPASAATGSISGRVTAADTGAGFSNAYVSIIDLANSVVLYQAYTTGDGRYTIGGIAPGQYRVAFSSPSAAYLYERYTDRHGTHAGDLVTVGDGQAVTGIDAALERSGTLSGRVTATDTGAGLAFVRVDIYVGTASIWWTYTDASGNYSAQMPFDPETDYAIGFDPPDPYQTNYYSGAATLAGANRLRIASGTAVTANASVAPSGVISGQVTASDTGAPLENVSVRLRHNGGVYLNTLQTDAAGRYATSEMIPNGSYELEFMPPSTGPARMYFGEYYQDAANAAQATPVVVSAGVTTTVNAVLQRGATISGRLTRSDTSAPLPDVTVFAQAGQASGFYATTDANGEYQIAGPLVAGSYALCFYSSSNPAPANLFLDECYNNRSSTYGTPRDLVTVAAGENRSGVDAVLQRGGSITGRVTAADTGAELAGVEVRVFVGVGDNAYARVTSDANGVYTTNLPLTGGAYRVDFVPAIGSPYVTTRTTANVTIGSVTTLDASLLRGGRIAGRVTASDGGAGLDEVDVTVSGLDTVFSERIRTNAGEYATTRPLPPGRYIVRFEPVLVEYRQTSEFGGKYVTGRAAEYLAEYAGDARDVDGATPVSVTSAATTVANAVLARAGSLIGRVTTAGGAAASNVFVQVYDAAGRLAAVAYTGDDGNYRTGALSAGWYRLAFNAGGFATIYSGGAATLAAAQPIRVEDGINTAAVNLTLQPNTGSISGRAYDAATGDVNPGTFVQALDAEGRPITMASVQPDGAFRIADLPRGEYRLRLVSPIETNHAPGISDIYYDGDTFASATVVSVTPPGDTGGIAFAVVSKGALYGTVYAGGERAVGVMVRVYDASGAVVAERKTPYGGSYRFVLPNGAYRIYFDTTNVPGASGYEPMFYGGATTLAVATPVQVTAPNSTGELITLLTAGGAIRGRVTNSAGAPLPNIWVRAYDASGRVVSSIESAQPNGEYILPVPAGSYRVSFNTDLAQNQFGPSFAPYGGAYHGGAVLDTATVLVVGTGQTVNAINAVLEPAGYIAGQIASDTGSSQYRVVQFFDSSGRHIASAVARDGSVVWPGTTPGAYRSPPLAPGVYRVRFSDTHIGWEERIKPQPEFFRSAGTLGAAQTVTVVAGQTTLGIDATLFRLQAGNVQPIAGVVTAADTSAALAGIVVQALDDSGTVVRQVETGSDGRYSLTGVTAAVRLRFTPPVSGPAAAYIPEYYSDRANASEAERVQPGTTGVHAALARGVQFAGTVTAADLLTAKHFVAAAGLTGVAVNVYDEAGLVVATATTDASGAYVTGPGLPAGNYKLGFTPPAGNGLLPTFFPLGSSLAEAVSQTVTTPGLVVPSAERSIFLPFALR
jgi:hypothetical protein